ncbi:hypothetical protein U716_02560 [Rhodobacter capsulatus B6]|nr:hypothetical protein U716_02560 [Rhodobacter capsulatus B6]
MTSPATPGACALPTTLMKTPAVGTAAMALPLASAVSSAPAVTVPPRVT